jgi:hypothetical protein
MVRHVVIAWGESALGAPQAGSTRALVKQSNHFHMSQLYRVAALHALVPGHQTR